MKKALLPSRGAKLNPKQRDFLADFMAVNTDLASGKLVKSKGKAAAQMLWRKFADEANLLGPPKDIAHWQKAWCDTKCRVRAKAAAIKGADVKSKFLDSTPLTPSEEKVYSIMVLDTAEGMPANDIAREDHESLILMVDDDADSHGEALEKMPVGSSEDLPERIYEIIMDAEGDNESKLCLADNISSGMHNGPLRGEERKSSSEDPSHETMPSPKKDLEDSWAGLYKLQEEQNKNSKSVAVVLNKMSDILLRSAVVEEKRNELLERLCRAVEGLVEVVQNTNKK